MVNKMGMLLDLDPSLIEIVARKTNVLPVFNPEHKKRVSHLKDLLKREKLLVCGNYFDGMAIEDCVLRSREEFERLKKMLSR